MSSLTRFPDVALPLPPRPIDAYVECTFKTPGSDDREDTASRWHSSYYRRSGSVSPLRVENEVRTSAGSKRPANALNDLCKVILAGWMTSKPKAKKGRDGSVDKKKLRTHFYPIHVRGIDVHIDKALLWSPGRSSRFWNIQMPPNLKKTSAISQAGCDSIALRF
ncbi:hypothetical protein EV363DRAFT_1343219 [Boletus edulis]|nr:hypothetical protein EV363DRAFT_1343219 [Boletus edulis]